MTILPLVGELCRYHCQSATNPNQNHMVDLLADECSCADWTCRQKAHRERTGQTFRCKHLRATREHFLSEILENLKLHAP